MGGEGFYNPRPAQRHFAALKRMLDRREPDYATCAGWPVGQRVLVEPARYFGK